MSDADRLLQLHQLQLATDEIMAAVYDATGVSDTQELMDWFDQRIQLARPEDQERLVKLKLALYEIDADLPLHL